MDQWELQQKQLPKPKNHCSAPGLMLRKSGGAGKKKRKRYESQCLWTAALCHHICVRHFMELLWLYYSILTRWQDILVFTMTHKYPKSHSAAAFSYSNTSLFYPTTYQCFICRKLSEQFSCFFKHRHSLWSHFYGLKLQDGFLRKLNDHISHLAAAGLSSQHVAHLTTSM